MEEAPRSGRINDEMTWRRLWSAWCGETELPKVDFEKQLILVGVSRCAQNWIRHEFIVDEKGNLKGGFERTLLDCPGFAYVIIVIDRPDVRASEGDR